MGSLANETISSTYDGLIKTNDEQPLPASGVRLLQDGSGNNSALSIGQANQGATVTGTLTATAFSGDLTGDVTGDLTGSVLTAAQTNITSVGTLSSLTVSGALNGTLSTASQPNITSVGTLSSLAVSGNLTVDTDTLYVDATSNEVGIGTSSPARTFHAVSSTGAHRFDSVGTASLLEFITTNNTTDFGVYMGCPASTTDTLAFGTDSTERVRITSSGYLKASNTGGYWSATGVYHELVQNSNGNWTAILNHQSTSAPYGIFIPYSGSSPNGTGSEYLYFTDSVGLRFSVRSNGGIANYSSNNVNLSDERVKTDITPLDSYWDKFKALELVTFKYKDQTHNDPNIGLIAQQVELVAPEFVSNEGFSDEDRNADPLKSIYTADLYHATIKVLQEAMAKIETLEEEVATLKSQINA